MSIIMQRRTQIEHLISGVQNAVIGACGAFFALIAGARVRRAGMIAPAYAFVDGRNLPRRRRLRT